jgi:hypothetical protein
MKEEKIITRISLSYNPGVEGNGGLSLLNEL